MKRSLSWALGASVIIVACATNEELDFTPPAEDPSSTILDGGTTTGPDGGPHTEVDAGGDPNASCGDGKKGAGEDCDDGNNASGDGCSATCKSESAGANDVCPGVAIALTGTGAETRKGSIAGDSSKVYPHYAGACGGGTGRDAVYSVTPDVTGLLTAKVTSAFDSVVYARRTCIDSKTEAACNDAQGSKGGDTIKVAVTQGQPVFLFVDGYSGSAGPFTLDVEVATAFCGNGVAEAPEACDDGNTNDGDGCSASCALESGGIVDDCPGQGVLLSGTGTTPRKISFAGTTANRAKSLSPSVCSGSGANTVYAITPDVDGSMTAKLVATYDNATLHVRTECDVIDTQLDCREATEPLQNLEITVPVKAGLPHYVIVDSASSTATYSGPYTLDVTVTPAQCGNKIIDGAEECDDGNATSGDGCTSTCKLEPIPSGLDTCPGVNLPLTAAAGGKYAAIVTSSTSSLSADYKPKSASCSTITTAKDAVFVVTSPIDGLMYATVNGTFDSAIYARNGCEADAAAFDDLACSAATDGSGQEQIKFAVNAGQPVYLVVDGEATAANGVFELAVEVSPSVCGNGAIEGGEQCDDSNKMAGDGCSPTCQLEPADKHDTCANAEEIVLAPGAGGTYAATVASGTTNLAHDQTFTGCSSAGRDAIFTVTAPIDGVLTVGVPAATFNVSLGARTTCPTSTTGTVPLVCANANSGDGPEEISFSVVKDQTYYVIVDGTSSSEYGPFTMLLNVRPPGCGDALISGSEQCDDGNLTNGDGCSATCTTEPLTGLDTCPGYALALSGTGTEPRTGVVTIDTKPLVANYAGTCGGSSKEGVVVVTPPIAGKLTAKLTGIDYHAVLYARMTCNDASTEKACDDDAPTPSTSSRDITIANVAAGVPIYLFVDGYNGAAGVARLNVTVTP